MSRAPLSEKLFIDGPAGRLEALLETPSGSDAPKAIAVVCHPHPLHEGTMHNKVAHTLARAFLDLDAAVLRFNFRGVGKSEGEFANAVGEVDDALAAFDYMHARWAGVPKWLAGFSFGAQVSLATSSRRRLDWLVSVAPPVERMALDELTLPECPWLLVQGGADEVVDPHKVAEWVRSLRTGPAFEWLDDTGHFFHGKLNELRALVVQHAPQAVQAGE